MYYQLENGEILWFKSLGNALHYAHLHNTRLVREDV